VVGGCRQSFSAGVRRLTFVGISWNVRPKSKEKEKGVPVLFFHFVRKKKKIGVAILIATPIALFKKKIIIPFSK
jgi:hypothetical protein